MSQLLLDAIAALDGTEQLVAFTSGLRVGYTHLGDQWITFIETPAGGQQQYFHPDAYAAYRYVCEQGLGEATFRLLAS
jgi:hypothetical protein